MKITIPDNLEKNIEYIKNDMVKNTSTSLANNAVQIKVVCMENYAHVAKNYMNKINEITKKLVDTQSYEIYIVPLKNNCFRVNDLATGMNLTLKGQRLFNSGK